MVTKRCARCGWAEAEHPESPAARSTLFRLPGCHRFEPKAPLWLRILNRAGRA